MSGVTAAGRPTARYTATGRNGTPAAPSARSVTTYDMTTQASVAAAVKRIGRLMLVSDMALRDPYEDEEPCR